MIVPWHGSGIGDLQACSEIMARMPMSVKVETNTGERVASCTHSALDRLLARAEEMRLPLLGLVDPYDDTIFNRFQMQRVVPELTKLRDSACTSEEAEAAAQLLVLTQDVDAKPHRYLVFIGD
jgi:hypothetical protein